MYAFLLDLILCAQKYISNYRREIFFSIFSYIENVLTYTVKSFGLTRKNFKSASCKLDNYLIYHTQVCFQIVHFLPDKPLILNFDSWLITSRREVSDKLSTIVSSTLIIKFLLIFSLCTYFVFLFAESTTVIRGCGNLRLLRKTLA